MDTNFSHWSSVWFPSVRLPAEVMLSVVLAPATLVLTLVALPTCEVVIELSKGKLSSRFSKRGWPWWLRFSCRRRYRFRANLTPQDGTLHWYGRPACSCRSATCFCISPLYPKAREQIGHENGLLPSCTIAMCLALLNNSPNVLSHRWHLCGLDFRCTFLSWTRSVHNAEKLFWQTPHTNGRSFSCRHRMCRVNDPLCPNAASQLLWGQVNFLIRRFFTRPTYCPAVPESFVPGGGSFVRDAATVASTSRKDDALCVHILLSASCIADSAAVNISGDFVVELTVEPFVDINSDDTGDEKVNTLSVSRVVKWSCSSSDVSLEGEEESKLTNLSPTLYEFLSHLLPAESICRYDGETLVNMVVPLEGGELWVVASTPVVFAAESRNEISMSMIPRVTQ